MDRACRVLIADHDQAMREALARTLGGDPTFEVLAEAGSARETVRVLRSMSRACEPLDVVVFDLEFQDIDHESALAALRDHCPDALLVAHTSASERETRSLLGDLMGYRYVQRGEADDLLRRLRSIRAGLITAG